MSSFFPPFSLFPEIFNRFVLLTGIRIHSEYYKQISNHLTEINPAPFSSSLEELKLLSQDVIQFTPRILCFSSALRLKGHQLRLDASKRLGLTPSMNQYDPQVIEMVNKIRNSVELAPLYNDAKALFSMAVQCDTFDITSEKLLLSIQTFDQKGKKELNKRYFERIASGTVCTWFEDLLRTKIEKKYKEVITGDLEEAEELMKKFISEGFKDLPTVTKAAEKYQCACIKARSFRNNYLIQLRPPPFSIHFASIVESLGRALYYQEYLEKKGVPDLSVSVLLFALEAYRECPAALVCREMAHLNELLSLLFQQLMQPLPSILLEISLLRLIRSIEANYQQCYINLTTLLQAFPKIDSDSSLRFRLMTVIAKMKPKEEGIQTLNYIASLLSSAIPPEELKQILSITEPQIFSYLLDLQDKFRRGEPGNLIRKRLNDANMLLMDAKERERESKLQVDQLLAQMLLHGLFTHSK